MNKKLGVYVSRQAVLVICDNVSVTLWLDWFEGVETNLINSGPPQDIDRMVESAVKLGRRLVGYKVIASKDALTAQRCEDGNLNGTAKYFYFSLDGYQIGVELYI